MLFGFLTVRVDLLLEGLFRFLVDWSSFWPNHCVRVKEYNVIIVYAIFTKHAIFSMRNNTLDSALSFFLAAAGSSPTPLKVSVIVKEDREI